MKRFVLTTLAVLALGVASVGADEPSEEEAAQLSGSCGEIKNRNNSSQFGSNLWLEYIVETARPYNSFDCPWLSVSVEAYVVGVPGSAHSGSDLYTATARRQVPVPWSGEWQTNGRHYRNYLWFFSFSNGETSSKAYVEAVSEEEEPQNEGEGDGGACGPNLDDLCEAESLPFLQAATPIIVDVNRNGYELTSLEDGVFFDLDADGAAELVSWTRATSDEAFLAMDRNGNGRIDDGSELFGNNTPIYPTGTRITASNGFEALKFLETPAFGRSERNEVIDARDAAFARLLLWTDRNHNGLSEPDELQPVTAVGLQAVATDYRVSRRRDQFGNEFRQRAKATWGEGEAFVYDVWLLRR